MEIVAAQMGKIRPKRSPAGVICVCSVPFPMQDVLAGMLHFHQSLMVRNSLSRRTDQLQLRGVTSKIRCHNCGENRSSVTEK
jgi:hypothetical protein